MSLFQRAWQNANLNPAERAILRLIENCIIAGLVSALPLLASLLSAQQVNWSDVARIAGAAFATAFIAAFKKYVAAQADAPLAQPSAPAVSAPVDSVTTPAL